MNICSFLFVSIGTSVLIFLLLSLWDELVSLYRTYPVDHLLWHKITFILFLIPVPFRRLLNVNASQGVGEKNFTVLKKSRKGAQWNPPSDGRHGNHYAYCNLSIWFLIFKSYTKKRDRPFSTSWRLGHVRWSGRETNVLGKSGLEDSAHQVLFIAHTGGYCTEVSSEYHTFHLERSYPTLELPKTFYVMRTGRLSIVCFLAVVSRSAAKALTCSTVA